MSYHIKRGINMFDVLIKALGFVIVIVIGFLLKQFRILKKEDGYTLATIIMNVTLPCALFSNANGITINGAMIVLILMGIILNVLMVAIGYFVSNGKSAPTRAAYMINCSGYNIGNFVLPFVQAFFPGMGVAYLCMFDVGNALMGLGGTFAIASSVVSSEQKLSVSNVIKKLFSSIPFCTYIILFFLSLFHIAIPTQILTVTSIAGNANAFLAMLMIGILLEIKLDLSQIRLIKKILLNRYAVTLGLSLFVYFILPIDLTVKKMIILCLCSPISAVAPVFSNRLGSRSPVPSAINSLSIIISIFIMTILILFMV